MLCGCCAVEEWGFYCCPASAGESRGFLARVGNLAALISILWTENLYWSTGESVFPHYIEGLALLSIHLCTHWNQPLTYALPAFHLYYWVPSLTYCFMAVPILTRAQLAVDELYPALCGAANQKGAGEAMKLYPALSSTGFCCKLGHLTSQLGHLSSQWVAGCPLRVKNFLGGLPSNCSGGGLFSPSPQCLGELWYLRLGLLLLDHN